MDIWTLIVGLAVIIGIVAGIVQVLDYLQKQREKKREPTAEEVTILSPPAPAVPSNLPPRGEFVGRKKEKARVREALASRWPLTCIDGIGGIGKTALALEVAGECLRASKGEVPADGIPTFDGFIWTTAKDRELVLNDVLDTIARTLDYPGIAQQPLEEKQESVRKLLQSKRYLLIVDNFETVTDDAVRDFLLRLPEPSKALITSREQKLRQVWAISLKGLEQGESLVLIRSEGRRLGLESVEKGEERVLLRLYQATGGAPLAIKWAVGQIKQKGQSLDTVLAALHEARGDIFERVFARSWSLLADEVRRILMVMPIFAASASRDAIEAASDVHHYALDEGLGQLVEMWLVEASDELDAAKRRYSIHPLTRAFAGTRLREDKEFERDARLRVAEWFLSFTERNGGYQNWDGFIMLEQELPNILAVMKWCHSSGQWQAVTGFGNQLANFLVTQAHWNEAIDTANWTIAAAERLDDRRGQAVECIALSWIHRHREDLAEARQWCEKGLRIFEALSDEEGIAYAKFEWGRIAKRQGEVEKAERFLQEARTYFQQHCTRDSTCDCHKLLTGRWACPFAHALLNLGSSAYDKGDYEEAQRQIEEAERVYNELGDESGLAAVFHMRGKIAHVQGTHDEAKQLFTQSLTLDQRLSVRHGVAWDKSWLALVEEQMGNSREALKLAKEAEEIYRRLGMTRELKETQTLIERLEGKLSATRPA